MAAKSRKCNETNLENTATLALYCGGWLYFSPVFLDFYLDKS
jgi:hypothetical protein